MRNPMRPGGHVTNFLTEILGSGGWTGKAKVSNLCKLFGWVETPIKELATADRASVLGS